MKFAALSRSFGGAFLPLCLAVLSGCENKPAKVCLESYGAAQKSVLEVDPKSLTSVSERLKAVEDALSACKAASRVDEMEQLQKAKNELSAQRALLERRAARKKARPLTPEEQAGLLKNGDPSCPRGQAYRAEPGNSASGLIRCTGPGLADMSLAQAKAHFQELDFRLSSPSPTELRAEHGAERFDFQYVSADATTPRCLVITPPPGLPWQEALARATGVNPGRLKNPGTVKTQGGSLAFKVDEKNVIIRLGECPE